MPLPLQGENSTPSMQLPEKREAFPIFIRTRWQVFASRTVHFIAHSSRFVPFYLQISPYPNIFTLRIRSEKEVQIAV